MMPRGEQYINPIRQAKKALRRKLGVTGKRLKALQKRHRRLYGRELDA